MKVTGFLKKIIFQQGEYFCFEVKTADGDLHQVAGNLGPFSKEYCKFKSIPFDFYGKHVTHHKYGNQIKLNLMCISQTAVPSDFIELLKSPFSKRAVLEDALVIEKYWNSASFSILKSQCYELYSNAMAVSHMQTIARHIKWKELVHKLVDSSSIDVPKLEMAFIQTPFKNLESMLTDPYLLAINKTIDFKTAELVGQGAKDNPNRAIAATLDIISKLTAKTKHTYISSSDVSKELRKSIAQTDIPCSPHIESFCINGESFVQDVQMMRIEEEMAEKLTKIVNCEASSPINTELLTDAFKTAGYEPTTCQVKGINILSNKVSVIAGLPGTGKTSLVKGLVETLYNDNQAEFIIISPTGTSAMRLSEVTGFEAKTIHSALGFNPSLNSFSKCADNPLDVDWVIIDESSMIDIYLGKALIEAIPDTASVVFFGDIDQIASIKEGAVLKDLFDALPSVRMITTKRFDKDGIIKFCHAICNGKVLYDNLNGLKVNIAKNENDLETWVKEAVLNILNISKKQSFEKVQILAPQYAGAAGIDAINEYCREHLFADETPIEITYGTKKNKFHIGSKVLIKVNMPEKGIYNGDIGFIQSYPGSYKDDFIKVLIRGREVSLNYNQTKNVIPGYCISIHNAQGQEYPYCLAIITKKGAKLLSRNLINSAISRGQRGVIVVSEKGALEACAERSDSNRATRLSGFLKELQTPSVGMENV